MLGISAVASILAEFAKLLNLIIGHANSPEMVSAKLAQLHEDMRTKVRDLEATLADSNKSDADKQRALQELRLIES